MERIEIKKIEFYITNVCNLACNECNRFNNLKLKGNQNWFDYVDVYAEWSKYIDIKNIVILGGEPLLNPSIKDWLRGLRTLWPNSVIQILTNGFRLGEIPGLYDTVKSIGDCWVGISLHSSDTHQIIEQQIFKYLKNNISRKEYLPTDPGNAKFGSKYFYQDYDYMYVPIWEEVIFEKNSVINLPNNKYTLHNSDPKIAHSNCSMAKFKSYHFINGEIYKCGPLHLFKVLDQQLDLELSKSDKILIDSFKPITVNDVKEKGSGAFLKIDEYTPQCKFCAEAPGSQLIDLTTMVSKIRQH